MEIYDIIKLVGAIIATILGTGFLLKLSFSKRNKKNNTKQIIKNGNNNIQAGRDIKNDTNEVK